METRVSEETATLTLAALTATGRVTKIKWLVPTHNSFFHRAYKQLARISRRRYCAGISRGRLPET
jgi:hypothetical protein